MREPYQTLLIPYQIVDAHPCSVSFAGRIVAIGNLLPKAEKIARRRLKPPKEKPIEETGVEPKNY